MLNLQLLSIETSQTGSDHHKGDDLATLKKQTKHTVKDCLKKMIETVKTGLGSWETAEKRCLIRMFKRTERAASTLHPVHSFTKHENGIVTISYRNTCFFPAAG